MLDVKLDLGNLSEKDAFEACVEYTAIKKHFNSDYDYFKYGGRVNLLKTTFDKKENRYYFYMLSKEHDYLNIILANVLHDRGVYIRDIQSSNGKKIYLEWKKRVDSLTYVFKEDLDKLNGSLKDAMEVTGGRHPELLKKYISNEICLETLCIIMNLTKINITWDKKISDPVVYPTINTLVENYLPFLEFDKKKFRKIILDREEKLK